MSEDGAEATIRTARNLRVAFGRLRRRLREVAATDELTTAQLSVLSRLDSGGPAGASALAAVERVRPQSMATILAVLQQRELIQRQPDPGDGRRQLVSLSDTGVEWIAGKRQAREEWLAHALRAHYTEAERRTIDEALALLDRLTGP